MHSVVLIFFFNIFVRLCFVIKSKRECESTPSYVSPWTQGNMKCRPCGVSGSDAAFVQQIYRQVCVGESFYSGLAK